MDEDKLQYLTRWLPDTISPNVRIVLSMIDETECHRILRSYKTNPTEIVVGKLDYESRKVMLLVLSFLLLSWFVGVAVVEVVVCAVFCFVVVVSAVIVICWCWSCCLCCFLLLLLLLTLFLLLSWFVAVVEVVVCAVFCCCFCCYRDLLMLLSLKLLFVLVSVVVIVVIVAIVAIIVVIVVIVVVSAVIVICWCFCRWSCCLCCFLFCCCCCCFCCYRDLLMLLSLKLLFVLFSVVVFLLFSLLLLMSLLFLFLLLSSMKTLPISHKSPILYTFFSPRLLWSTLYLVTTNVLTTNKWTCYFARKARRIHCGCPLPARNYACTVYSEWWTRKYNRYPTTCLGKTFTHHLSSYSLMVRESLWSSEVYLLYTYSM